MAASMTPLRKRRGGQRDTDRQTETERQTVLSNVKSSDARHGGMGLVTSEETECDREAMDVLIFDRSSDLVELPFQITEGITQPPVSFSVFFNRTEELVKLIFRGSGPYRQQAQTLKGLPARPASAAALKGAASLASVEITYSGIYSPTVS